jgi:hypothetical protein
VAASLFGRSLGLGDGRSSALVSHVSKARCPAHLHAAPDMTAFSEERRILESGEDSGLVVLGDSQPSPSTSSGQALRDSSSDEKVAPQGLKPSSVGFLTARLKVVP